MMHVIPDGKKFLITIADRKQEIDAAYVNDLEARFPGSTCFSSVLYSVLLPLMHESRFETLMSSIPEDSGLEAWRRINRAANPLGARPELKGLTNVLKVEPASLDLSNLRQLILDWEESSSDYERRTGKAIEDDLKASVYRELVPNFTPLAEHLDLNDGDFPTASSLRNFIMEYVEARIPSAMDITALGGGGKGKGSGKDGGKTAKFQGDCHHCGKSGHRQRDCWKWKAEQEAKSSSSSSSWPSSSGGGGKGGAGGGGSKGGGKPGGGKGGSGGGKPKGKGKGKGVHAVHYDDWGSCEGVTWSQVWDGQQEEEQEEGEEHTVALLNPLLSSMSSSSSSFVAENWYNSS